MTAPQGSPTPEATTAPVAANNEKEINLQKQRLMYEKMLENERKAREEAERKAQELLQKKAPVIEEDDDDDDEPYVDRRKLQKKLNQFGQQTMKQTQSEIQKAVQEALYQERQQNWIKNNKDFYDVMQHADKLAAHDPELAETILEMPDGFERQKLVYKNIKALGLHKPTTPEPTIQDKIDANKRSPYYRPSGVGTAPYAQVGDFSDSGKANAYAKMKELKKRLGG